MFIDTQLAFSEAQSVVKVAVGDVVSTNVVDVGSASDIGVGQRQYLFVKLVAALAGAGSKIQAVLQTSADNVTFTDAAAGPVVALAAATANKVLARLALPIGLQRYNRVAYRISGAASTGGTASAYIIEDAQDNTAYASGVSAV